MVPGLTATVLLSDGQGRPARAVADAVEEWGTLCEGVSRRLGWTDHAF
jgi:hypothetical protein